MSLFANEAKKEISKRSSLSMGMHKIGLSKSPNENPNFEEKLTFAVTDLKSWGADRIKKSVPNVLPKLSLEGREWVFMMDFIEVSPSI